MVPRTAPASAHELWRAWRQALAILLGGAAVYVLFDALLFRTGLYDRILDPHSSTGVVEFTLSAEGAHDYFAKPVLILGNFVMAEGFSARLANWLQLAKGYEFSNAAVAGTLERSWHYMLRDLDPDCRRYSVPSGVLQVLQLLRIVAGAASRTADIRASLPGSGPERGVIVSEVGLELK